MHRIAQAALPAPEEFAIVQPRYIVMPALLWALAMLGVVIATVVGNAAEPTPPQATAGEEFVGLAHGA